MDTTDDPRHRTARSWRRTGLLLTAVGTTLGFFLGACAFLLPNDALALSDGERAILLQSVRQGELAGIEARTGGLDTLPLVAVEVHLEQQTRTLHGFARIDWPNRTGAPLDHLLYRLAANGESDTPFVDWTELKVSIAGAKPVPVTSKRLSPKLFRVDLPKPLPPNARVVLQGALVGKLARVSPEAVDPAAGLDLTGVMTGGQSKRTTHSGAQYGTLACGEGICTVTGFAPEIPAFLDSAFDALASSGIGDPVYSEPANLLLSVVTDSDSLVAATGIETGRVPAGEGKRRTTFALVASREAGFVASPNFVVHEAQLNGVRIRSFSLKQHESSGKRVLNTARGALKAFDDAFGRYPWATLDIAESALTGGAGGVELPALTLGATGFYGPPPPHLALADPTDALWGEMLDFITRHEVAHEWWHAQVGSHPQLHPYIDEPLAQWAALYATAKTEGQAAAMRAQEQQIELNFQALALFGIEDGIVARRADAFASPIEYAGLVYGKAPLFYVELAKLIGTNTLAKALKGVVSTHRFGRLTPQELKAALVKAGGKKGPEVGQLWNRWFHQTHGETDIGSLSFSSFIDNLAGPDTIPPELRQMLDNIDPSLIFDAMQHVQELLGIDQ